MTSTEPASFSRILRHPAFAVILLVLMAVILNWPYLSAGFYADDFMIVNALESDEIDFSRWRGIWSTEQFPGFEHLWWKDADWRGVLFRPLPSLVIEGSLYAFGNTAFPLHLLSVLLHAGVVTCLFLFVRILTRRHWLAFLAALFYVTCEDLSFVVGWIATFTDILCVQFIMLALLAHLHWLYKRKPWALGASLIATMAAMACKETAVVAPVALILLSFFEDGPRPAGSSTPLDWRDHIRRLRRDRLSWAPATALLVIYISGYTTLNLGVMNNLLYVNPFIEPGRYLVHAAIHLPITWLATLTPFPPLIMWYFPATVVPMAIAGLVIFAAWLPALRPLRSEPLAAWALVLYVIALLPQLSTDASERALYFPLVPAAILLAYTATAIGPIHRRLRPGSPPFPRWTRVMGWFLVLVVLVPGAVISFTRPPDLIRGFEKPARQLRKVFPEIRREDPDHIIVLNASDWGMAMYAGDIIDYYIDQPQDVWLLSAAFGKFSLERTGDSTLVIRTDRAGWLSNAFGRVMRTRSHFLVGQEYKTAFFTATILKITADGEDVLSVRFDFNLSLDEPKLLFLRWNGQQYELFNVGSLKIGQTVALADTSDPWKSLL
jgi:hypothetical protein